MILRPRRTPRTATLFPDAPLFRSGLTPRSTRGSAPARDRTFHRGDQRANLLGTGRCDRDVQAPEHELDEPPQQRATDPEASRSEEHTSELQSLMRISYAVFCLKKKNNNTSTHKITIHTPKQT